MIELTEGIILSRGAPKEPVSFLFDKGQLNVIPLNEKYKFSFLRLRDQSLDKGTFKIDDTTIYPNEENGKALFFLQVNSLIKLGLCFVCDKENKKAKVKEVQDGLITLRELPTETDEEKNAKIAAIFAKIREFLPSYVILDLNDEGNRNNEYLLNELESLAKEILVIAYEKKPEEIKPAEAPAEEVEQKENPEQELDDIEKEDEIVSLDIGEVTVQSKYSDKEEVESEDFIVFDFTKKSFFNAFIKTIKNNIMVFLSFIIPTTGIIAFLLLSPLYYQSDNKVLLIPFIITIVICFVLYFIMTYKCTGFYFNRKDPHFKTKVGIYNIANILATAIGIGLGVVIYILFKTFDNELKKMVFTNTIGIILSIVLSVVLLTSNFYLCIVINKIKKLFRRKK